MFRSLPRITAAVVLVFAFFLSTVPAQAQPRDLGASIDVDASWLEAALGWIQSWFGDDSAPLQTMATKGTPPLDYVTTGPCIDPYGTGCIDNP